MHSYTPRRKEQADQSTQDAASRTNVAAGRIPNSAMLTLNGISDPGGYAKPNLEQRMRAHLSGVLERPQAQIPQAENEADRLSAAVNAGTPESVKTMMGRRMGADFSGVRFHTGAAAAARADAMGARAYTSGADVYFGSGGFDPSVAAHELVHTAQQGMVDSGVATMSTPTGGVQMNPLKTLWEKTGGRLIRKQHDKIDEFHQIVADGTWAQLSPEQQAAYLKEHKTARRYMNNQSVRDKAAARSEKRQQELNAAQAFIATKQGPSSMLRTAAPATGAAGAAPQLTIGRGMADPVEESAPEEEDALDAVADTLGKWDQRLDNTVGILDTLGVDTGHLGTGAGAVSFANNAVGTVQSFKKLKKDWKGSSGVERLDLLVDVADNAAGTGDSFSGLMENFGAEMGPAGNVFGIAHGSTTMYKGGRQVHQGRMKRKAMNQFQEGHYGDMTREQVAALSDNDLLMRDIATQAKMEGTRQMVKGSGKLVTGAAEVAGNIAELTGVGAAAGKGIKAFGKAAEGAFAAGNRIQKNKMEKKLTQQVTGLTDADIKAFQKANGIKSFSRAKQALMKSYGYSSGTRAELYADQTEKRGKYLAEKANASDAMANELVQGLGVKRGDTGYEADDITQQLGHWKSREEIVNKTNKRRRRINELLTARPARAGN